MKAQELRPPRRTRDSRFGLLSFALWLPVGFLIVLGLSAFLQQVPWMIPSAYFLCSLASVAGYGHDKAKAERGEWRTPEFTLHFLDGLGGWPGGLIAQRIFRHKTRKLSFQIVFWLCVIIHGAGWLWIFLKVPAESELIPFLERVAQSFATFFAERK
jgi:uncharacterized membrane protein YsdA (DUF1294 family)